MSKSKKDRRRHLYISGCSSLMCGRDDHRRETTIHIESTTCPECIEAHRVAIKIAESALWDVFRAIGKEQGMDARFIVTMSNLDERVAFVKRVRAAMEQR